MSRVPVFKRKRRSARKTFLIFTEGLDESCFLKYLKSLYSIHRNVEINIKKGKGGSADRLIIQAHKIPGSFNARAVVMDNDRGKWEMKKAREIATSKNIILIENTPCLEAVLLMILQKGKDFSVKKSKWCKSEFESRYINHNDREDISEYSKHFPKKILDKSRSNISSLDTVISLLEGKN